MKPSFPDHYQTLELGRRCTAAEIKAAYRRLAKKHHPDRNPSSPEAALLARGLNLAHEVLSDPARRRAYDEELAAHLGEPLVEKSARGERNISQELRVRIDELIRGASFEIRVKEPSNPDGEERYELALPPNTAPKTRFRVPRAEPFTGGWVEVRISVLPSARFKARGSDLRYELRINARRAAEGGSEMIPSPLGGMLRVSIPSGIARGGVLRLAGEGLPKSRGGRGDLLVRVTYRPEVQISRTMRR